MRLGILLGVLAGGLVLLGATPAAAQSIPTRAEIDTACQPGTDPQPPGNDAYAGGLHSYQTELTPTHLAGATTISVAEAKCLIDRFGEAIVVLSGYEGTPSLPGAYDASRASSPDPAVQPQFVSALAEITGGDMQRPLITYCHHVECFLSYNVASRAVTAGYKNVFWMRQGMAGWKQAGYAGVEAVEAGPEPAPETPSPISDGYRSSVQRCIARVTELDAEGFAGLLVQIPTETEQLAHFAALQSRLVEEWNACLDGVQETAAENATDRADVPSTRSAGEDAIAKRFVLLREEVESDPAYYLAITMAELQPPALRQAMAQVRAVQSLDQACGSFDFSQPYISSEMRDAVDAMQDRWDVYQACVDGYQRQPVAAAARTIEVANVWIKGTRRYTCAESRNPKCIGSQPYTDIAGVATDANLALAKERAEYHSSERQRANATIDQLNEWWDTLNRRIREYNDSH